MFLVLLKILFLLIKTTIFLDSISKIGTILYYYLVEKDYFIQASESKIKIL